MKNDRFPSICTVMVLLWVNSQSLACGSISRSTPSSATWETCSGAFLHNFLSENILKNVHVWGVLVALHCIEIMFLCLIWCLYCYYPAYRSMHCTTILDHRTAAYLWKWQNRAGKSSTSKKETNNKQKQNKTLKNKKQTKKFEMNPQEGLGTRRRGCLKWPRTLTSYL